MLRTTTHYLHSFLYGENEFHQLLKNCTSVEEISEFLTEHDANTIQYMLHSVDYRGNLPIDLIKNSQLLEQDKKIVENILLALTKKK